MTLFFFQSCDHISGKKDDHTGKKITIVKKVGLKPGLNRSLQDSNGIITESYAIRRKQYVGLKNTIVLKDTIDIIWNREIKNDKILNVTYFVNDGHLEQSFYPNGMIKDSKYTINDVNGGYPDGLWKEFDSVGNIITESFYDYSRNYNSIKFYTMGQIDSSKEFYYAGGESEAIPNGVWEYFPNGSHPRKVVYKMGKMIEWKK